MIGAFKQSNIDWIGEIPSEWDIIRMKQYAYLKGRIGWQGLKAEEFIDEGPYLVTGTDFDNGRICWERSYHVSERRYNEAPQIQLRAGDLLVTKDGTIGKLAYVDSLPGKASLNSHLLLIRPLRGKFCNEYLYWVLGSSVFQGYYELTGQDGTTMDSLSQQKIGNFNFATPPLYEQKAISAFLDDRCGYIDGIVDDLERQVEILRQYKKALITETVTKGLDKSALMKDSGIDWIGDMPNHWEIRRLKYCLAEQLQYGANESGDTFEEGLPRYIRITDIDSDNTLKEGGKLSLSYNIAKPYLLRDGDVLFARSGATVGKSFYYDEKYGVAAFAGYLIKARANRQILLPRYLYFVTLGTGYEIWKDQVFSQATIQNIGADKYALLFMTIPPITEQAGIVDFLDAKCTEVDTLIAEKQRSTEIMRQYKWSLIYEYVTGKKRVKS